MALFKISKGNSENINTTIPNTVEGYCYFNLYNNNFYIDTETGQANSDSRRVLFAGGLISPTYILNSGGTSLIKFTNGIPELSNATIGSSTKPVYLSGGSIVECSNSLGNDENGNPISETYLPLTGGTLSGNLNFSNSSAWITPYLLAFKNANTSASPTYPYTGFYQWGDEWQVNARDSSNTFAHNIMSINLASKVARFEARPTVQGSEIALKSDIPSLAGGTAAAANATVIGGVTVVGHTINASTKKLKAGSNVTITGTAAEILIASTNTTYSAGTGLSLSGTTFNHKNSVTAGVASGDANKTLAWGGTFTIPSITYDAQGHITGKSTTTMTMPANPNSDTKVTTTAQTSSKIYVTGCTGATTGTLQYNTNVYISGNVMYGACWNDYAEYRISDCQEPGRVICENGDDTLSLATERLQPAGNVISDTFGFAIGETEMAKTPIAVSGRVLVYPYEDRYSYNPGDAVCAAPGGTVSKMTREEIITYPERIIGTVSAIPEYETWGEGNIPVDGRIWIKVK